MMCSELKHTTGGRGDEEESSSDLGHNDSVSETGSSHMIMEGGVQDEDVIPRAESPIPGDHESEIGSNVSNPLEDSEYVYRCQVCHIAGGRPY